MTFVLISLGQATSCLSKAFAQKIGSINIIRSFFILLIVISRYQLFKVIIVIIIGDLILIISRVFVLFRFFFFILFVGLDRVLILFVLGRSSLMSWLDKWLRSRLKELIINFVNFTVEYLTDNEG